MKFTELSLPGAYIVDIEPISDSRGFFARTSCSEIFKANGLAENFVQCSISYNYLKGTVRGMHIQISPHQEEKLIRCTMGSVYDVIVDLRANSPTYKQWVSLELSAENRRMVYIPKGMAHGFQTLKNNSELLYQISEYYHPESARTFRWSDETIGISWPLEVTEISDKDRSAASFEDLCPELEIVNW